MIDAMTLVDADFYYETNPDVRAPGADPTAHYHAFGRLEGRYPNRDELEHDRLLLITSDSFDEAYYRSVADVPEGSDAADHFLLQGSKSGFRRWRIWTPSGNGRISRRSECRRRRW